MVWSHVYKLILTGCNINCGYLFIYTEDELSKLLPSHVITGKITEFFIVSVNPPTYFPFPNTRKYRYIHTGLNKSLWQQGRWSKTCFGYGILNSIKHSKQKSMDLISSSFPNIFLWKEIRDNVCARYFMHLIEHPHRITWRTYFFGLKWSSYTLV